MKYKYVFAVQIIFGENFPNQGTWYYSKTQNLTQDKKQIFWMTRHTAETIFNSFNRSWQLPTALVKLIKKRIKVPF